MVLGDKPLVFISPIHLANDTWNPNSGGAIFKKKSVIDFFVSMIWNIACILHFIIPL